MNDLEFIKAFSKIKVKTICDELGIDKSNLWRGNTSPENIKKVKEKIIEKIESLF